MFFLYIKIIVFGNKIHFILLFYNKNVKTEFNFNLKGRFQYLSIVILKYMIKNTIKSIVTYFSDQIQGILLYEYFISIFIYFLKDFDCDKKISILITILDENGLILISKFSCLNQKLKNIS